MFNLNLKLARLRFKLKVRSYKPLSYGLYDLKLKVYSWLAIIIKNKGRTTERDIRVASVSIMQNIFLRFKVLLNLEKFGNLSIFPDFFL